MMGEEVNVEDKLIYTLGTSTRSPEEFIELLSSHGVEVVVDVRRSPSSRFEHFRRERLEELLPEGGIDYVYMGEELGGYRRGGYKNFTATSQFQAGLSKLEEIARKRSTAIICAERFPWRCHRRFIALELEKRGWQVSHIIDKGRNWVPRKRSANDKQPKRSFDSKGLSYYDWSGGQRKTGVTKPFKVWKDVYQVGGAEISHPYDCSVYLLDADDLVLVDCGAGKSFDRLVANIKQLGFDPKKLKVILVTHAHIDHIGALHDFKDSFGVQVIAHEFDAGKIERGYGTGAEVYGVNYLPCPVDHKIKQAQDSLRFGDYELKIVHIPGHTPGSIAAYIDIDKKRILFGQDIHGPYNPEWGADPKQAKLSLQKLAELKADILCEGHFGIYQPGPAVESYIRGYLNSL